MAILAAGTPYSEKPSARAATASPGRRSVTPGPTAATMPTDSKPASNGSLLAAAAALA